MGRGRVGLARDRLLAGGNSLFRQRGAFGLVGGKVGQVKTRPGEFPGRGRLARRVLVARLRCLEVPLRVGGEPRFGGRRIRQGLIGLREEAQANQAHQTVAHEIGVANAMNQFIVIRQ